jgi:hypothetical protein
VATFCGRDNLTKIQCWKGGGGLVIAKLQPASQIHLARPVSLLNHTTINLVMEVSHKRGGSCGPRVPGGGPDHGGQQQRTMQRGWHCCKPPINVPYKCTFGMPDQGQMLDM